MGGSAVEPTYETLCVCHIPLTTDNIQHNKWKIKIILLRAIGLITICTRIQVGKSLPKVCLKVREQLKN